MRRDEIEYFLKENFEPLVESLIFNDIYDTVIDAMTVLYDSKDKSNAKLISFGKFLIDKVTLKTDVPVQTVHGLVKDFNSWLKEAYDPDNKENDKLVEEELEYISLDDALEELQDLKNRRLEDTHIVAIKKTDGKISIDALIDRLVNMRNQGVEEVELESNSETGVLYGTIINNDEDDKRIIKNIASRL